MEQFKLTLGQARKAREFTQEEMAQELGVHVDTYRTLEKNPGRITVDQMRVICNKLKMKSDDIFFTPYST